MSSIEISFDIQGTCTQQLRVLNDDYSGDDIIAGLEDGSLVTSTWHDGRHTDSTVVRVSDMEDIAEIVSQEIDGEYDEFEG